MKQVKKQLGQIKEPRNSSLEILRIICIVLVVTFHCFIWMGWKHNDFAIANTSWVWCVLCLMMITGYFSINKKNRILKVIILFLLFYILLIIEGLIVFSSLKENFAMTEWTPWTKEVVDIPANHFWWSTIFSINFPIPGLGLPENEAAGQFWYMITYIITIFFIPFINMGLKNLNKWFSLSLVVGILCMVNVFQQSGTWTMVILFSGMYAIGGWLRLYLVNINKQMCITCFVIIVSIVLVRNLTVAFGYEKDIHYTDDTLHGYDSVYMMMFYDLLLWN